MAKADFYLYIKAKPAANTELLCFFLTLKLYGWKSNLLLGRVEKNTIVLKQNSNTFRISNIDSSSHTITIHRVSKNKTLLHCAILYYTNDCAALINMDMRDGTMTSTKVWSICGPESPTASISNGDLKISIRPWRNVTLIMPGNEFSATLSD